MSYFQMTKLNGQVIKMSRAFKCALNKNLVDLIQESSWMSFSPTFDFDIGRSIRADREADWLHMGVHHGQLGPLV